MSGSPSPSREARADHWGALSVALTSRNLWSTIAAVEVALTLLSTLPGDVRKPLLNLTAGTVASAALLLVIGGGWALILRRLSGGWMIIAALPVIVSAAVVRGLVLQWLLVQWGMSQTGAGGYQYRVFGSIVVVVTCAAVGALVSANVKAHRYRLEQLGVLQRQLSLVLVQAEGQLRADQSGVVAAVSSQLTSQLEMVRDGASQGTVDHLEYMATEVVRPLSHQLAAASPRWNPPDPSSLQQRLDWSAVWASIPSPGAINPWAPALVVLAVTPSSVLALGFGRALLMHAVAAFFVYLGLLVLRRSSGLVIPPGPTLVRLLFMGALLVLACVPAGIATWFVAPAPLKWVNAAYVVVLVPLIALMFAVIGAARAQRRSMDAEITELVAQTGWWVTRTRMMLWWQNAAAARALHGPVQSLIHAAAQRLRAIAADGEVSRDELRAVLSETAESLPRVMVGSGDVGFEARLNDAVTAWRPLAAVEFDIEDGTAQMLDGDPVCAEILIDVIAEAIANAVRHGGARHLCVRVEALASNVIVTTVTDDGIGHENQANPEGVGGGSQGLGTAQLDTCALMWDYEGTEGGNQLRVQLPILAGSAASVASDRQLAIG